MLYVVGYTIIIHVFMCNSRIPVITVSLQIVLVLSKFVNLNLFRLIDHKHNNH